jgi:hypothetical protein
LISKSQYTSLNEEDSAPGIALKTTKYKHDKHPWYSRIGQTNSKIHLLAFPFFNVAYYNYNCHSGISIVFHKVLLILLFLNYLF